MQYSGSITNNSIKTRFNTATYQTPTWTDLEPLPLMERRKREILN
jgi:hypothetical protein